MSKYWFTSAVCCVLAATAVTLAVGWSDGPIIVAAAAALGLVVYTGRELFG